MQIMNLILGMLGFLLVLLPAVILFILIYPCVYIIEGTWQEQLKGGISLICGSFKLHLVYGENNKMKVCFSLGGIKSVDIAVWDNRLELGTDHNKKVKVQNCEKQNNKKENQERPCLLELLKCLDSDMLSSFVNIVKKFKPVTFKIRGKLGFTDPYYTGLLAAALAVKPCGEQVVIDTDFSGKVRDVRFQIKGKFIFVVLLYYVGQVVFAGSFKPVIWVWMKKKMRYNYH